MERTDREKEEKHTIKDNRCMYMKFGSRTFKHI